MDHGTSPQKCLSRKSLFFDLVFVPDTKIPSYSKQACVTHDDLNLIKTDNLIGPTLLAKQIKQSDWSKLISTWIGCKKEFHLR